MKNIVLIVLFLGFTQVQAQHKQSLKDCIALALNEKPSFLADQIRVENSALAVKGAQSALGPQISLSYAYKYNAIIPTSLVPNALTGGNDTSSNLDGFTELQFGTTWQQDLGITLLQPLFDAKTRAEVKERRAAERLELLKRDREKEQLVYDVMKAYIGLSQKQAKVNASLVDTVRTYGTMSLMKARYQEGKLLKSELNTAIINHNNAKSTLAIATEEKRLEQFNLGFLIGSAIPMEVYELNAEPIEMIYPKMREGSDLVKESVTARIIKEEDALLVRQIIGNRAKRLPTLAIDGFYGANQFNENLRPFENDTWFGNSYIGVSLKVPIIGSDGTRSKVAQLKGERKIQEQELREETNRTQLEQRELETKIVSLAGEIALLKENLELRTESVAIYQARFSQGKADAYELNEQELVLQKSAVTLLEKEAQFWATLLDKYKANGTIGTFLN